MERNKYFMPLSSSYLFSCIQIKTAQFGRDYPDAELLDLSIGNTTLPLDSTVLTAFLRSVEELGNEETYRGYGPEFGAESLRAAIANDLYDSLVEPDEVFVSDGAKVDLFRLLACFGPGRIVAVQDPSYPAYIDSATLTGAKKIVKMACREANQFAPEIPRERIDVLCICSPNNPTGTVLDTQQLQRIVDYANSNGSVIIFDASYSAFISDPSLPKSIFSIPGARFCAVEVNSFSKPLGFTGVRLGWTIVPKDLAYKDGSAVITDWRRFLSATFNGASIPAQRAALAGVSLFPYPESIAYYKENSDLLRDSLSQRFSLYGGLHAPYLWVKVPHVDDEHLFEFFLNEYHVAITPGYGFGEHGKGFVRFSAFAQRQTIEKACLRFSPIPV